MKSIRDYINLLSEADAQPVVPANQTPPQPGAVKESGYDEVTRLVNLVHYR